MNLAKSKGIESDEVIIQDLKINIQKLKERKKDLEQQLSLTDKPSKNQKRLRLTVSYNDYNAIRDKIMETEKQLLRLKRVLSQYEPKSIGTELELHKEILRQNLTEEQLQTCWNYIKTADQNARIDLQFSKAESKNADNELIQRLSNIKKDLYSELKIMQLIRKEMGLLMSKFERTLSRQEFGETIKILSSLNKAIPTEGELSKKIISIPKK